MGESIKNNRIDNKVMMDLNELKYKAYHCAVTHGWHEDNLSDEHFLCLVISELMEAVEADRKGSHADFEAFINTITALTLRKTSSVKSKELSRKNLPTPASDCWIWPD